MEANFIAISQALSAAGLKESAQDKTGKPVDFKITPYSLNSKLSFRFAGAGAFIAFLDRMGEDLDGEKAVRIKTALQELGLDPGEFFYVNFFEKGKSLDM